MLTSNNSKILTHTKLLARDEEGKICDIIEGQKHLIVVIAE